MASGTFNPDILHTLTRLWFEVEARNVDTFFDEFFDV
jgi:hypothetical protein